MTDSPSRQGRSVRIGSRESGGVDPGVTSTGGHPDGFAAVVRRRLERMLSGAACVAALIFLSVLVSNLVGLLFIRHPMIGYSDNMLADAEAVATGHFQYGNPATQFVGMPYTPLFTWIVAALLRVSWWPGWGPLVSMLAGIAVIASLVHLLWSGSRSLKHRLVTTSFVITLVLGALSAFPILGTFPISALEEGRPDLLAWALLIIAGTGIFRGFFSGGLSTPRRVVAGLLLTGSVFTKQITLVPAIAIALVAVTLPTAAERGESSIARWRRSATVILVFFSSSALLGVVLQFASHGYAYDELVQLPLRYGRLVPLWHQAGTSLRLLIIPLVAFVVLVVAAAISFRVDRERYTHRDRVIAVAAIIVGLSPIPTAVLAEAKLGGEANQLTGPALTLSLACAVLLLLVRVSIRQLLAASVACGVLLLGVDPFSQAIPGQLGVPDLHQTVTWQAMDPFLVTASSKRQAVFDWIYPSLSVSPRASSYPVGDVHDSLAGGYTPRWFINNLLTGRYSLVTGIGQWEPGYESNLNRYDASVLWKINLMITMGYAPVRDASTGNLYYRPSPALKRIQWFSQCFGPYQAPLAGVQIPSKTRLRD